MKQPYLEITFRRGKPFAAYLYLPREPGVTSARTEEVRPGLLVDDSAEGRPIGLEILAPAAVDGALINAVLLELQLAPMPLSDLEPLRAA